MALLARTDPDHLRLLAHRPGRDVGRLVLVMALPARFDADRAGDLDATYELQLRHPDGEGYDPVAIRVRDGHCTVRPTAADDPDCTLRIRLDDLVLLVSGQVPVQAVLSDGRLGFSGDVLLFLQFPGLFGGLG